MGTQITTDFFTANGKGFVLQGPLQEVLLRRPAHGVRAVPLDIPACRLEFGITPTYPTGAWFGDVGHLTKAQLDSWYASGAFANLATGSTATAGGVQYTYQGAEVGWKAASVSDPFGVIRPAPKSPMIAPFRDPTLAAKFAAIQNDGGVMTIVCVGESTTKGEGAAGIIAASINPHIGSFPWHIANELREITGVHVSEMHCPPRHNGASDFDPRWAAAGGFAKTGLGNALGSTFEASTSGAVLKFKSLENFAWNAATVAYLRSPAYSGAANVEATGGSPVGISTNNAARIYDAVTVIAADVRVDNEVTITTTNAGNVVIAWIELYDSTRGCRIRIANFGVGGTTSHDWQNTTGTGIYGYTPIKNLQPDLALLCLGGNDSSNSLATSSFLVRMQAIVTGIGSSAQKIGLLPITPRTTEAKRLIVDDYVAGYATLTGANLINYGPALWSQWRDYLPPSADGSVHLASPGYKRVADLILDQICY